MKYTQRSSCFKSPQNWKLGLASVLLGTMEPCSMEPCGWHLIHSSKTSFRNEPPPKWRRECYIAGRWGKENWLLLFSRAQVVILVASAEIVQQISPLDLGVQGDLFQRKKASFSEAMGRQTKIPIHCCLLGCFLWYILIGRKEFFLIVLQKCSEPR